jgi:hypothetical protein
MVARASHDLQGEAFGMKVSDLLDNVARTADDDSDEFRAAALRWLNLVRAHVAERARWKGSIRVDTFSTSSSNTTGLYALSRYSHLAESRLYDVTNKQPILHESHALLNEIDAAKETTGPPSWWGDAGSDGRGDRMLYLWPIPDGTFTIRFTGQSNLVDLESADEDATIDPYFGRLSFWADVFDEGLQYHRLRDTNENAEQTLAQLRIFDRFIDGKKMVDRVSPTVSIELKNIRQRGLGMARGRLDPAHFEN